ncbi:MAG: asparagine--tRNA ligase [Bacteroidales bacterium]
MSRVKINKVLTMRPSDDIIVVKGWVRTKRGSKNVSFLALNDGSTINNLQIVIEADKTDEDTLQKITSGAAIAVEGRIVESQGAGQAVELVAQTVRVLGECNADAYPIQPKKHSLEFLRDNAHLRFRTNTFGAVTRIRHAMIFAVHNFFNNKGFCNIHTPIITASDCEGAGEMFRVSTIPPNQYSLSKDGNIDFSKDFFGRETSLTVSGQLEGEMAALAMSEIYTFGPTFRAENSNTTRHLAEFWMIEPEMAFYDINDNMNLAEDFLKSLIQYAFDNCMEDLQFLSKRLVEEEKNKAQNERSLELIEKLKFVLENSFKRLTYSEAIDILKNSKPNKKGQFTYPITGFGDDLQSEHERFLVEKHFKCPVILTDYPKDIKAFYMKQNDDGKTVRAMDILFPGIGEIIGGSEREADLQKLQTRMKEMDIPSEQMWWYLDSRRYGSVEHSGFGLGFERLMMFVTGMNNIRDVIPFPRTPKNAEF